MSSSSSSNLSALPAEILKRIASYSTCESILSLIKCNRSLYNNCHDAYVYKSILVNRGNHPTFTSSWDVSFLERNAPAHQVARYALADSKAREWVVTEDARLEEEKEDKIGFIRTIQLIVAPGHNPEPPSPILSFLPHLCFYDHPINVLAPITSVIKAFGPSIRDPVYTQPLNYVVSILLLTQYHAAEHQFQHRQVFAQLWDALHNASFNSAGGPNPLFITLALLQNRSQNAMRMSVAPLNPSNVPLRELISFPMPFEDVQTHQFWTINKSALVSREFIEAGTWTGYYSYGAIHNATFDPAMREIRFKAREQDDKSIDLESNGVDMVGDFILSGSVQPDGSLTMSKHYAHGISWAWTGRLTPLGFLGFWGSTPRRNQGWFWLWKEQWIG